jgi:hypothetical protein
MIQSIIDENSNNVLFKAFLDKQTEIVIEISGIDPELIINIIPVLCETLNGKTVVFVTDRNINQFGERIEYKEKIRINVVDGKFPIQTHPNNTSWIINSDKDLMKSLSLVQEEKEEKNESVVQEEKKIVREVADQESILTVINNIINNTIDKKNYLPVHLELYNVISSIKEKL